MRFRQWAVVRTSGRTVPLWSCSFGTVLAGFVRSGEIHIVTGRMGTKNAGGAARPAVRQRLLDSLHPLAPLTVFCGIPGTAKSTLVKQMYDQADPGDSLGCARVLVDLPRRHIGVKAAVSLAAEAVLTQTGAPGADAGLVAAIRRGRFDLDEVAASTSAWANSAGSCTIFVPNYEWHACPELDALLAKTVVAGMDVVCTLVDADTLAARARAEGIAVKVVCDADLCFSPPELQQLALFYGVEPTSAVIDRVERLTAGHPMMASVAMMALAGFERVVVNHNDVVFMGETLAGGRITLAQLEDDEARATRPLRHADPNELGPVHMDKTAAVLRYQEAEVDEFRRSDQGHAPFTRFTTGFLGVPWAGLDALETVWPGCSPYVSRLNAAGYAHLEFDASGSGRLVWNDNVRIVAAEWNRQAPSSAPSDDAPGSLRRRLVEWYAQQGRFNEAVELVSWAGAPDLVEWLATSHFVDLVSDGHSHGFSAFLPETETDARARPATTVLAALESHPLARDDQAVAHIVLAAIAELETRCASENPDIACTACLHTLVGLTVLDRWEQTEGLPERALWALAQSQLPSTSGEENARTYLLIGFLSLAGAQLRTARVALSRAAALARHDRDVFVASAVGLHVLEGYFGQILFDSSVDRDELMDEYRTASEQGLGWWESVVVIALAQTWGSLWRGEYEQALGTIRTVVAQSPRSAIQPMVVWTYTLLLLLNGLPSLAHAFYREVEDRVRDSGQPQRSSSIHVLGFVLTCLADSRVEEAFAVASRRTGTEDVFDRLTDAAIGMASGRELIWEPAGTSGVSIPAPTARTRTMLAMADVIALVHDGRGAEARERMRGVLVTASPNDVDLACRFLSPKVNAALVELVANCPPGDVKDAIRNALDGPHVFKDARDRIRLSEAQLEVLRCLDKGMRNQEIADTLYLSVNTVKTHLREINRRLGASNRHEALAIARRNGLLES